MQPIAQAELGQQLRRHLAGAAAGVVVELQRHLDVFQGGQRFEQVVGLKDETDLAADLDQLARRAAAQDRPMTSRVPSCTERKAPASTSRVVFPEPEGPVMITISPGSSVKLMSVEHLLAVLAGAEIVIQAADPHRGPGLR